ncbi:MAG TPA: beta-galactosidase family protein [Armatimonadota bacterium]|nr:beta-galactosidase family protein [Armatimonadota bacterium]
MHQLATEGQSFTLDGQPFRILSGAMHYFRVMPEYWRDRLLKLKACGLNTLETYVPWNLHEPTPGEFDFSGILDIEQYIRMAGELGLNVIVRPGPYICSEWDFGGLPAWLLAIPGMQLRCCNKQYLDTVDRFFDELLPRLVPLQASHDGPIIALQVENEYGSYGDDKIYLRHLEDGMRQRGIDAFLFTSDGPNDTMLQGGTLPHVLKTANFGSNPEENFAKLREYQPDGPLMCMEYWNGWFDHWGEEHHMRDPHDAAQTLDAILAAGASMNLYMFHGGTNFGFMSGANCSATKYEPDVTSYDYDAPLDEAGDPTPKYWAFRDVIGKYAPLPDISIPGPSPKGNYGTVTLQDVAPLLSSLETLAAPVASPTPVPMEQLGQNYGFILYRTKLSGPRDAQPLVLQDVHDRAHIFIDGDYQGIIERNTPDEVPTLAFTPGEHQLDILVENMGHTNYGPYLIDLKGITQGVRLGNQFLFNWVIYPLPLTDLTSLRFTEAKGTQPMPAFYRGTVHIADAPRDTFLALPGWTKGVCFINGFNLGRYWKIGPQQTLYIPAPLLKTGDNDIIVFELDGVTTPRVEFRDKASL